MRASTIKAAPFADTFVDPEFRDCARQAEDLKGWNGNTHGSAFDGAAVAEAHDIDGDRRWGPAQPAPGAEDGDGDAIFGTIQSAIQATMDGGVVHLLVPGVYREALAVDRSVTIRAIAGIDVVLDGACGVVPTTGSALLDTAVNVTAGGALVTLENVTIRGWRFGMRVNTALDPGPVTLRVVRCRFEDNFFLTGSSACVKNANGRIEVFDSEFHRNQHSIDAGACDVVIADCLIEGARNTSGVLIEGDSGSLTVTNSRFIHNAVVGLDARTGAGLVGYPIRIHASTFADNGVGGLWLEGSRTAHGIVDGCTITGNRGNGLTLRSQASSPTSPTHFIVRNCSINSNAGDGVTMLAGPGSCCSIASVISSSVAANSGFGLNTTGPTLTYNCSPGGNQLSFNTLGNDPGGTCTPAGVLTPATQVD